MEYRAIPGRTEVLSAVGLGFPAGGGRGALPGTLSSGALLRRASEAGFTFLDAIRQDAPAEVARIARASPVGTQRFVIAVGVDSAAPDRLAPGVAPSPDGPTIIPIARDPSQSDLRAPGFARAMERLVSTLGAPVWGAAWTSGTDAQLCAHDALALGARLIGLPISLLSFAAALEIGRKATDAGAGLVGLDPMAGGALDGSFLTGSPLERDAGSRPSTLGELTERLGPITQLGFLTEGRRRTLPQAAVRFVLDLPAVVSVSCDIRSPATILELASVERVPSLSDEELDRVSRLGR